MFIAKKIMVFILMFAILVVLREVGSIVIEMNSKDGKYEPSKARVLYFALALSYILTIMFTGFRLF